jgi:Rrf2 family protein
MLGKTGLHAIRALTVLATSDAKSFVGTAVIAARIRSPRNYLGKLLQSLARVGLVEGRKGLAGGFRLARWPDTISLYDVVEPIERISRWNGCFLDHGACRSDHPCRVHQRWSAVRESYVGFLKETTLVDVAEDQGSELLKVLPGPNPTARRRNRV